MAEVTAQPARYIKLECPTDDPLITDAVRRLAQEYWQIIQRHAEARELLICRAWLYSSVDLEEVTWFPMPIHCDATPEEAWELHLDTDDDVGAWKDTLTPTLRSISRRISPSVVGLNRPADWLNVLLSRRASSDRG